MKKTLLALAVSVVMTLACASVAFADEQADGQDVAAISTQATQADGANDAAGDGNANADDGAAADGTEPSAPGNADNANAGDNADGNGATNEQPSDDSATTPSEGGNAAEGNEPEQPAVLIDLTTAVITIPTQNYTGKGLEPAPTVTLNDEALTLNVDFTVAYADNKAVGTATATITGIGKYTGTGSTTFAIDHAAQLAAFQDLDAGEWYLSADQGVMPDTQTYYLDIVVARGLMLGYEDESGARIAFGPNDPVTRGQVVTMLYRLSHPDATDTTDATAIAAATNTTQLPDVAGSKFYTAAVNWAVEAGVVSGYRDVVDRYYSFGADDPITREQLATMVGRFCVGCLGMAAGDANIGTFSDYSYISDFAKTGIQFCMANSIMTGYAGSHTFGPGDQATRSQMAKVMAMLATLTDEDASIAENGWPTESVWKGGEAFPQADPSNWEYVGGSWYYRNADDTYATGMLEINGYKVLFGEDGKMYTGWYKPGDGTTYHFADTGIAAKGWEFTDGRWHYFDETTSVFVKKSLTNDLDLDAYIDGIAASCGYDLGRCFDWMWNMGHVQSLDSRHHWGIVSDEISLEYVRMARNAGACDCYGDASLFCWLARACGYSANFRAGGCPSASAGTVPHGWTEVYINGVTYVCDANLRRDLPGANWYMVTYDTAPLWYTL